MRKIFSRIFNYNLRTISNYTRNEDWDSFLEARELFSIQKKKDRDDERILLLCDKAIMSGIEEAYIYRAHTLQLLEFHFDAILDFTHAIANYPYDANLYYCRGHSKMILCDFKEAINDHKKALELSQVQNETNNSLNFNAKELGWESAALFYQSQLEICVQRKEDYENNKGIHQILSKRLANFKHRII